MDKCIRMECEIMRRNSIIIIAAVLFLAATAMAVPEKLTVEPYQVTFDLNNTVNYTVDVRQPYELTGTQKGSVYPIWINTSNITVASIGIISFDDLVDATLETEKNLLALSMVASGYQNVTIYSQPIDDIQGCLGVGQAQSGAMLIRAWYWPDSQPCDCGPVAVGSTKVDILSQYPPDVTLNLLSSLSVVRSGPAA